MKRRAERNEREACGSILEKVRSRLKVLNK